MLFYSVSAEKNHSQRTIWVIAILIDSFIWLVCRVEPKERAKVVAIGAGAGTFTVLPVDDLKNRA